jgi:hypothetical protein
VKTFVHVFLQESESAAEPGCCSVAALDCLQVDKHKQCDNWLIIIEGLHTVEPFPFLLLKKIGPTFVRVPLNSFAKSLICNFYADFVKGSPRSIVLLNMKVERFNEKLPC